MSEKQKLFEYVDALAEEEEVEREISSALHNIGYEPGSADWKRNMVRWKALRISNPRFYKKFVSYD